MGPNQKLSPMLQQSSPTFIPAVSSIAKTNLAWLAHIRALVQWGAPTLLISAYDIIRSSNSDREAALLLLADAKAAGATIFLDSGGYEARWIRDDTWSWSEWEEALRFIPYTVAFTYDLKGLSPLLAFDQATRTADPANLIPIVHGSTRSVLSILDDVIAREPAAVAITERESGNGLSDVAENLRTVSAAIGGKAPLHLLGAGNPKSILLYASCGVHSFDGLDWCQTVADPDTVTMHHSKHLELYEATESPDRATGNYHLRLLAHNLTFFSEWTNTIRSAMAEDRIRVLLDAVLPGFAVNERVT
jgi:queuine/archaeosine tRNA-ribosyltransferase